MSPVVTNLIEDLRNEDNGQLIDKGKVIDRLLDLRLAAEGHVAIVAIIDARLSNVPGKSVVEVAWWQETLTELAAMGEHELTV